ncbi:MAG: hypothetical protein HY647_00960 [Acidobacteria bacterium]|nr:hypothetical protein [Acidobacteriota bacterium]
MQGTRRKARAGHGWARLWNRFWNSPLPTLGCEICPSGVSAARWSAGADRLETAAWRPLPAGAVEASPLRDNLRQPEAVRQALGASLQSLGLSVSGESLARPLEAVLVVPDQAARLFVLNFEAFPERPAEALPVLRWRLKKSVPFEIEAAAISYFAQRISGQWQVVAVATPQSVIRQYEGVAQDLGLRPRWVTLSTLGCLGWMQNSRGNGSRSPGGIQDKMASGSDTTGFPDDRAPGVLLVRYSPPWLTLCILQQDCLRLFRTVALTMEGNGSPLASQVLEALYPSLAYFQDHFQSPLAQAYLCGLGDEDAVTATVLEKELGIRSEPLLSDPDSLPAGLDRVAGERYFASLLGVIREQQNG